MIKSLLIAATVLAATPSFAQSVGVPSMSLGTADTSSNISCRNKARAKYFELGARDMSSEDNNSQWATINSMKALVWCRNGNQAIIAVSGNSFNSVAELRDEIQKAF